MNKGTDGIRLTSGCMAWGVGNQVRGTCRGLGCQPAEFGVYWRSPEGGQHDRGQLVLRALSAEDAAAQEGLVQPHPLPRCLSRQARQDHSQSPWPLATENNVSSLSLRNCSWVFGPSHFRTVGCRWPRRGGLGPPAAQAQAKPPWPWARVWFWGEAQGPERPGGVSLDSKAVPGSPGCLVGWEKVGVGLPGVASGYGGAGEEKALGSDNTRTGEGPLLPLLAEQEQGGLQPQRRAGRLGSSSPHPPPSLQAEIWGKSSPAHPSSVKWVR